MRNYNKHTVLALIQTQTGSAHRALCGVKSKSMSWLIYQRSRDPLPLPCVCEVRLFKTITFELDFRDENPGSAMLIASSRTDDFHLNSELFHMQRTSQQKEEHPPPEKNQRAQDWSCRESHSMLVLLHHGLQQLLLLHSRTVSGSGESNCAKVTR